MLTGTLGLLLSVEDFISKKYIISLRIYFPISLRVLDGYDGDVATSGGGLRGGGSAMENLFESAVASADVSPAPFVAVGENAVAAAGAVVAFAAFFMVGIAAVAAMVVLPSTAFFKERSSTWAFLLMLIMSFSAILSSI